jgi:pSer/pThr/pTyr-binding forkhead associated (FHA) protein
MASLLILKGTDPGKHVELTGERILLGRNRDCQVVIDFPAVSREHAQIVRVGESYYIEDKESRNGTFVNNQAIKGRTLLNENDRIKICDFLCTFHEGLAPKSPPQSFQPLTAQAEPEPEEEGSSIVETSLGRLSSHQLLQSQPAEKLKLLLEITYQLGKTLDLDALLPRIADSLFQLYRQADRCFLIMKDPATGKLFPKLIKTRRAGTDASARYSKSIVQRCLDTGESLLSEDASADSRFATSQSIADFRIRSVMCAPLGNPEGNIFGVIQLDTQDRSKKFTQDDLKLLMGVASQAGIALENVQMHQDLVARERFQRDLELASQVQRSFLPRQSPEIKGYQFFAHYESALEIGGDYYDFIPLADGRLALTLGDVAGKGAPAALLMAKLSAEVRFCMLTE